MKKAMTIVFLTCFAMSFCTQAGAKMTLKYGMAAPPVHWHVKSAKLFADYVKEKTNGEITIDVFPLSQLGGERSMVEQVQGGTLDIADVTTAVLSNFVPQVAAFDLPFIWPSRGVAYSVLNDSEFQKIMFDLFPKKGMHAFGYGENEFRDFTNTKKAVRSPADMKGLKIRVMEAPVYLDTWRALGANPVPMPFPEVYNGLQQGVIDAQENPLLTSMMMKFTEVCPHSTELNYSLTGTIKTINLDLWKKFTPEQQQIFLDGAVMAIKANREGSMKMELGFAEKVQKSGKVAITHLTAEERAAFQKAVQPLYDKYEKKLGKIPSKEEYGRFAGVSYLQMVQEKIKQYQ